MSAQTPDALARAFVKVGAGLEQNVGRALGMAGSLAVGHAKQTSMFHDRSAVLRNSIDYDGPVGSFSAGDMHITVTAGAEHASYIEKGTRPHEIRPTFRKALRWPIEGGYAFARIVRHPGTAPRPFLEAARDWTVPKLRDELIPKAIELSFVQAGFRP